MLSFKGSDPKEMRMGVGPLASAASLFLPGWTVAWKTCLLWEIRGDLFVSLVKELKKQFNHVL